MHPAQCHFISEVAAKHHERFVGARVLELGSYDVNGTVRQFFTAPERYVGVDWRPGPLVDVVSVCHELRLDEPLFDVLISSEMLEHDPHWKLSLARGVEHLAGDGLVILTCGSVDRPEHEVHVAPEQGYYQGVKRGELQDHMASLGVVGRAVYGDNGQDVYYAGKKS